MPARQACRPLIHLDPIAGLCPAYPVHLFRPRGAMVLLDNGKFLTELHRLFEGNKDKGSVFVTMKRSESGHANATSPLQRA